MTGRSIIADQLAALRADSFTAISMVRLDFESGVLRVHSGVGTITWDGESYLGVGALGQIEAIEETTDAVAQDITLTLSGIPSEYISLALGEHYQGRDARIYLAALDSQHRLILDEEGDGPYLVFRGRMDTMPIHDGDTGTVQVICRNRLADWDRPRERRYTHEDQQIDYPGDLGLQFVAQMVDKEIIWGR